jgi:sporulation protein YlmC with PRC-barrel domain
VKWGALHLEIDETSRLIASNKVEGTEVYSRAGEHLGEVHNFMVDKFTGQVSYAVMSFGGFLGIGQRYHALPWEALDYDVEQGGYIVDVDKEKLKSAPSFGSEEDPWLDPEYPAGIRNYWSSPTLLGAV